MTLRLALVNPPYGTSGQSMRPLGLMSLGAYVKSKFQSSLEVRLFDFSDAEIGGVSCIDDEFLCNADLVGISAYSSNFLTAVNWANKIRHSFRRSESRIVIGGHHASEAVSHILTAYSDTFDYVIAGEGEIPLEKLLRAISVGNFFPSRIAGLYFKGLETSVVIKAEMVANLDELPSPIVHMVSPYERPLKFFDKIDGRLRNAVALVSSRGCPFGCDFCTLRRQKWRAISIPTMLKWIEDLSQESSGPVEHIYFMDALLFTRPDRVLEIANAVAEHYPNATWSGSARADQIIKLAGDLPRLFKQGLRLVEIGAESGSDVALKRFAKGITARQNLEAINALQANNIVIALDFIMFFPDQTIQDLKDNLEFLRQANLTEMLPHDHFYSFLTPYPGTPSRSFYETLFKQKFSFDELPAPDELFIDSESKNVFRIFVREFDEYRRRLSRLISRVEEASIRYAISNGDLAQRLRVESISLRHVPYLLLRDLCNAPNSRSLIEASPWLENFAQFESELMHATKQ